MKLYFFCLLFLASGITYCQESFQSLGPDNLDNQISFKIENRKSNTVYIWMKVEFTPIKAKKKNGEDITLYKGSQLTYMSINCQEKTTDMYNYVEYDPKGILIKKVDLSEFGTKIIPESISEAIYYKVCK
jgi:hypothetical protein